MNRIKEIREREGLTQDELAVRMGTTSQQVGRLENGQRKLTVEWMNKLAIALDCYPSDLIENAIIADMINEVEPAEPSGLESVRKALADRGISTYVVKVDSVASVLPVGTVITVDETIKDFDAVESGQVVLINLAEKGAKDRVKALRVYIRPGLLSTNRSRGNTAFRTDDKAFEVELVGRVLN